ncbi:MAG: hypothetical protein IKA07_05875 [Alistipes sp.]|nr:hypothetical protein [Alistipes sp.]
MKKTILLGLAAVAVFFTGCVKDQTIDNLVDTDIQRGALVEKGLIFEDDTRLERDGVSGKLSWSEGDQIQVVLKGEGGALTLDSQKYTVDHINNKVAVPENTAYVLYMSPKPSISGATASFNLPYNVTNLASAEAIFDQNPMKGVVEGEYIAFKNLLGYIKVPVKGEGKLQGVIVRSTCRTSSEFHPIAQSASLDLSKTVGENGNLKMATNNAAFSYLKYTYKEGLDITNGEDLYIALPAGEYENMGLVFITDKGSHAVYANNKHTVTRSAIKPISASHINLAAHTPTNPVSLAGTTGKAYEDYARCYMVPPTAGSYEFPCILADGVVLKGGVTAEIKWAEEAGMVYDLHYDPATNKISFKTNGKKGNALVVLTNGNQGNNAIIWHWHIWITDAPKTLKIMGSGKNANVAYYLMDRVLGATWVPTSNIETTSTVTLSNQNVAFNNTIALENASDACGVYFQYQSCNPLPRIKSLGDKTKENISTLHNTRCDVAYGFSQYSQYWATSASAANIFASSFTEEGQTLYVHNGITLPNYEYRANEGNKDLWNLSNIINQQGKTSPTSVLVSEGNYRLWNSINNNEHDEMMKYKTAHDPCPPGYIMENYSVLYWYATISDAVKAKFGYARAAEDDATYKSGYKFYGMYYNDCKDKDDNAVPMYWPCAGNRTSGITGVAGQYANCGYIYVVNTNNTNTYTVTKDSKTYTVGNGGAMAFGEIGNGYTAPGLLNPSPSKTVNAQGYNVRCRRGKF